MIVKTLFEHDGQLRPGEVEIKLLPGIPQLHVVGQPDARIKECGIKLKSALRSCDFQWPKGHQIVVNLRPSHFRKSSSGADLAIALGFLALTNQISRELKAQLTESVVYGEVALNGKVFAPPDLPEALQVTRSLVTGVVEAGVRDGSWSELDRLDSEKAKPVSRKFDWKSFWREPQLPDLELHPEAAESLLLASHMQLNVLVGGPQGSGKSTWAKALYALTMPPEPRQIMESQRLFGDEVLERKWRPCESPHHSIPPLSMIGGGSPLVPGVISRAHGGLLIMDEFLQFDTSVLEALREPVENGFIEHARRGERARFPARFQLIGTTNLCHCGKLNPEMEVKGRCGCKLPALRTVLGRLSGPVMDRFDLLQFSHRWMKLAEGVPLSQLKIRLRELAEFRQHRGVSKETAPDWVRDLEHGYRRRNSVLRIARGLADLEGSVAIEYHHYTEAYDRAVRPMESLRQIIG